jgi:hypothetical protein
VRAAIYPVNLLPSVITETGVEIHRYIFSARFGAALAIRPWLLTGKSTPDQFNDDDDRGG